MKMKSEDHQDIIKQLADRLREHSVPYKEGAWERFKEMEKKKSSPILMLWPYLSAAAVILIVIILFFNRSQQIETPSELLVQGIEKSELKEENIIKEVEAPSLQAGKIDKEPAPKVERLKPNRVPASASEVVIAKTDISDGSIQNAGEIGTLKVDKMAAYHTGDKGIAEKSKTKETIAEPSLMASVKEKKEPVDFLTALSALKEDESFLPNKSMDKKWSIGLDVSPNVGNNKHVNMGGGVSFAYSVSPKVSISSGISYLQVGAEGMPNYSSLNSPSASPGLAGPADFSSPGVAYPGGKSQTKTLHKIESSVVGLDIPFNVNYHVNDRLFASAGISVFNVLNEGRVSQFENRVVDVVYRGAENKTPEPVVHTFYSNETISEKDYAARNVNGFFNFSVGYSIPVSKKVGLSIEPFYKIQMSTLTEQDINLSNGGIKISTRF
jgi:hypothetical protein